jgi:hypothetical protein
MKKKEATVYTPHNHKCQCGLVWHHDPALITPDPGDDRETVERLNVIYDAAHVCPKCKADVRMVDDSGAEPTLLWTGRDKPEPIKAEPKYHDTEKMRTKRAMMKLRLQLDVLFG